MLVCWSKSSNRLIQKFPNNGTMCWRVFVFWPRNSKLLIQKVQNTDIHYDFANFPRPTHVQGPSGSWRMLNMECVHSTTHMQLQRSDSHLAFQQASSDFVQSLCTIASSSNWINTPGYSQLFDHVLNMLSVIQHPCRYRSIEPADSGLQKGYPETFAYHA